MDKVLISAEANRLAATFICVYQRKLEVTQSATHIFVAFNRVAEVACRLTIPHAANTAASINQACPTSPEVRRMEHLLHDLMRQPIRSWGSDIDCSMFGENGELVRYAQKLRPLPIATRLCATH